ncbi:MAG: MFS transporter [Oscillatoriales cyanobacterium SM2_1_8]|nr:MFS transporter [Oscillatoriales cyanobacterium SM2_1_8]
MFAQLGVRPAVMPKNLQGMPKLDAWSQRSLRSCFVVALLFWVSMSAQLPTLPLYARSLGGDDRQVGLVMGAFAVGLMLSRGRWAGCPIGGGGGWRCRWGWGRRA